MQLFIVYTNTGQVLSPYTANHLGLFLKYYFRTLGGAIDHSALGLSHDVMFMTILNHIKSIMVVQYIYASLSL